MNKIFGVAAVFMIVAVTGCGRAPTAPARDGALVPSQMTASAGVQKQAISGTIGLLGVLPPERSRMTPSGMCHAWEVDEFTMFDGDLQGPVTFHASSHQRCDGTHLVASGPFDGDMTFNGRAGTISGMWETNCKIDESIGGLSCDGTMNARGAGGLDGVQFHFTWGPGWFPFPYSGTAFSQ